MANLMPPISYAVTTGLKVYNARPTFATDLAKVDKYSAWLGMAAHPMTPHILTGHNAESNATGTVGGLSTTSGGFGDWHYLELIVPPFATWLQWGVICLGKGEVRFNPYDIGGAAHYLMKIKTENYTTDKTADAMESHWATNAVPTFTTDKPRAANMVNGSDGTRHPRVVTCRFQIKMTSGYFGIQSLMFSFSPVAPSTDVSGYATTGGGGADL